jgi:ABC-type multidrug transport system ATPase subunit
MLLDFSAILEPSGAKIMSLIKFEGITKTFKTQRDTLFKFKTSNQSPHKSLYNHINGQIERGDFIHLTGANGSGKTTLLKIISGIIRPDQGSILTTTTGVAIFEDSVFHPELTLKENFHLFSGLNGLSRSRSNELCQNFQKTSQWIVSFQSKYLSLSQGQRSLFALEASLLLNPSLLILDEPFANMDGSNRAKAFQEIKHYADNGGAVVLTSHPSEGIAAQKKWKLENQELHFL